MKQHVIFDTEIVGNEYPVFLICTKVLETGERRAFWGHDDEDVQALGEMLMNPAYTWVGFNSEKFDRPLIAALGMGYDEHFIKHLAQTIIAEELTSWTTYKKFQLDFLEYDHIDIMEVPPGVQMSLKIYAGRMCYPTMQDMPFAHDQDLTEDQLPELEAYCWNDIGVTEALFRIISKELATRVELGEIYGVDLRSKSDAQAAEAILRKVCGLKSGASKPPATVRYRVPPFVKTDCPALIDLMTMLEDWHFEVNPKNGAVSFPDFLADPIKINNGLYQFGIGGLHSQHDKRFYYDASTSPLNCSDFDVASYYPNIIMKAGLIPVLSGGRGDAFIAAYKDIYDKRIAAKRRGDKRLANTLKIVLNGTFGKLGSMFASFYSPDLMLAVTLTGQLNLCCLIWELEKIEGVTVASANTDGLMVLYPPEADEQVLCVFGANADLTGFEYEETPYSKVALRDVNSYVAISGEGTKVIIGPNWSLVEQPSYVEVKRKGDYAKAGVMENVSPRMQVCADAVVAYLLQGTPIAETIYNCEDMAAFTEIRQVKGGGVQHLETELIDEWVLVEDHGSAKNVWECTHTGKRMKRKSKPKPIEIGVGGVPFGRVARWYMTTEFLPPITYVGSGNQVAGTEGAKLCMNLPDKLPDDLNRRWYVLAAQEMLDAASVV